jgi:hypothetical protein
VFVVVSAPVSFLSDFSYNLGGPHSIPFLVNMDSNSISRAIYIKEVNFPYRCLVEPWRYVPVNPEVMNSLEFSGVVLDVVSHHLPFPSVRVGHFTTYTPP